MEDASSYTLSDVESVFSDASATSSVSSQFSTPDINSVIDELVVLLGRDETISSLCSQAVKGESIGRERLKRNLRRLLKLYATELKTAARGFLQNLAAQFVLSRSRYISAGIIKLCDLGYQPPQEETSALFDETRQSRVKEFLQRLNESDSEDEEDIGPSLDTLEDVQEFLISGPAFGHLQENIRRFVNGQPIIDFHHAAMSQLNHTSLSLKNAHHNQEEQSFHDQHLKYDAQVGHIMRPTHFPWVTTLKRQIQRWARPPVQEDVRRFEWNCVSTTTDFYRLVILTL